jgi:hypothetical protein
MIISLPNTEMTTEVNLFFCCTSFFLATDRNSQQDATELWILFEEMKHTCINLKNKVACPFATLFSKKKLQIRRNRVHFFA